MARVPTGSDSQAKPIRGYRQYEDRLPRKAQRRAYDGGRQVVAYSREHQVRIYRASAELREQGVRNSIGSVKKYWRNAIETDWRGQLVAKRSDPNVRVVNTLTTSGLREVYAQGSSNASTVAKHEAAVRALLEGDPSKMAAWKAEHGEKVWRGADGNW